MRCERTSQNSRERSALPKAPPTLARLAFARRDLDVGSTGKAEAHDHIWTGKVETHDCMLLRAPIAPSPLTRFFCFSAAGPATDCLLSSELRPFCLLLTAALVDDCTSLYNPERLFRAHKPL